MFFRRNKSPPVGVAAPSAPAPAASNPKPNSHAPKRGPTHIYSVRVRETFKEEVRDAINDEESDVRRRTGHARRVTEGAFIEQVFDDYRAKHPPGSPGYMVPIREEVWTCLHEIAQKMRVPPAELFEQLVIAKGCEVGVLKKPSS